MSAERSAKCKVVDNRIETVVLFAHLCMEQGDTRAEEAMGGLKRQK